MRVVRALSEGNVFIVVAILTHWLYRTLNVITMICNLGEVRGATTLRHTVKFNEQVAQVRLGCGCTRWEIGGDGTEVTLNWEISGFPEHLRVLRTLRTRRESNAEVILADGSAERVTLQVDQIDG